MSERQKWPAALLARPKLELRGACQGRGPLLSFPFVRESERRERERERERE